MAEKRKDSNGRILKTGESQRPNGTYMYRYTDTFGNKQWCYAPTLNELREKEKEIQRDKDDGIDTKAGEATVAELVEKHIAQLKNIRTNTRLRYNVTLANIKKQVFSTRRIKDIRPSDAKAFLVHMSEDEGYAYSTILVIRCLLKAAFRIATEDNIIRTNPFDFPISGLIKKDAPEKIALTSQQKDAYLSFMLQNKWSAKYYDQIVILLETGMRVSELYGLTISDVDLINRCIHVERQLQRLGDGKYYVALPKTKNGVRTIPLSDNAYSAFKRVLQNRKVPKIETVVDGYGSFVFLNTTGRPRTSGDLQIVLKRILKKYNETHDIKLPTITAHTFRHTFITDMYTRGLDIKYIQSIVGHGSAQLTLDIYTHINYEQVRAEFNRVNLM